MCLAVPGKILCFDKIYATVEIMGINQKINIQFIEAPSIGDYVLIHAGFAIEKIHEAYYQFLEEQYDEYITYAENNK